MRAGTWNSTPDSASTPPWRPSTSATAASWRTSCASSLADRPALRRRHTRLPLTAHRLRPHPAPTPTVQSRTPSTSDRPDRRHAAIVERPGGARPSWRSSVSSWASVAVGVQHRPAHRCCPGSRTDVGAPVYDADAPDPDVIRVGTTYYAYTTASGSGNIPVLSSTDLQNWQPVGDALPVLPTWSEKGRTWSPGVVVLGGQYVMYYATEVAATGDECISIATSPSTRRARSSTPRRHRSSARRAWAGPSIPSPSSTRPARCISYWKSNAGRFAGTGVHLGGAARPRRHVAGVVTAGRAHPGPGLGIHGRGARHGRSVGLVRPVLFRGAVEQRRLRGGLRRLREPVRAVHQTRGRAHPPLRRGAARPGR